MIITRAQALIESLPPCAVADISDNRPAYRTSSGCLPHASFHLDISQRLTYRPRNSKTVRYLRRNLYPTCPSGPRSFLKPSFARNDSQMRQSCRGQQAPTFEGDFVHQTNPYIACCPSKYEDLMRYRESYDKSTLLGKIGFDNVQIRTGAGVVRQAESARPLHSL